MKGSWTQVGLNQQDAELQWIDLPLGISYLSIKTMMEKNQSTESTGGNDVLWFKFL